MPKSGSSWQRGVVPGAGMVVEIEDTRPRLDRVMAWRPVPTYVVSFDSVDSFTDVYSGQLNLGRLTLETEAVVALGGNVRVQMTIPAPSSDKTPTEVFIPARLISARPPLGTLKRSVGLELDLDTQTKALLRALFHEALLLDGLLNEWTPPPRALPDPLSDDDEDRRVHERYAYGDEVRLRSASVEAVGRGIDLSEGGVSICALTLPPDPRGDVELMLSLVDGLPPFKVHGTVAWARPASFGGTHLVGIAFHPLAERTRRRIRRWADEGASA